MCSGDDFAETLKRIRYPNAHKLSGESFDWLFLEKDAVPLLATFCTLTEENVLSSEELIEYSSLTPDDLLELEAFELPSEESKFLDEAKSEELKFLKQRLSELQDHIKLLETQRDDHKKHEKLLTEKKENLEKILMGQTRKFQNFEVEKLPQIEKQLIASYKSISTSAQELDLLLNKASDDDIYFPTKDLFKSDTQVYLKNEKKLLDNIKYYLESNFDQFKGLDDFSENVNIIPADVQEEQMREVLFLRKVLKVAKQHKTKSIIEREKRYGQLEFYESLKDPNVLPNYELPDTILKEKLDIAKDSLERLKKQEKKLQADYELSMCRIVNAMCEQIAAVCSLEKMQVYKSYINKMEIPLDLLLAQKARLEFFLTFCSLQEEKFRNIKKMLLRVTEELKEDHAKFVNRTEYYNNIINDKEESDEIEYLSEDSVLFHLYKILENPEKPNDALQITPLDVLKQIDSLYRTDVNLKKHREDQLDSSMKVLQLLEKKMFSLESIALGKDRRCEELAEQEHLMDVELNKLTLKHNNVLKTMTEHMRSFEAKRKLIDRSEYLRKARKLYVLSATDKELFKKYIADIKCAAENSSNYQPT